MCTEIIQLEYVRSAEANDHDQRYKTDYSLGNKRTVYEEH